jgi:hypothetical protein
MSRLRLPIPEAGRSTKQVPFLPGSIQAVLEKRDEKIESRRFLLAEIVNSVHTVRDYAVVCKGCLFLFTEDEWQHHRHKKGIRLANPVRM